MIRIRNVHARRFVASIDRIGALIDSLAAEHDDLWPRDWWPPIRLDGPLRVGARGGHARVRHFVEDYERSRSVTSTLFSVMHVYPVLFPMAFIVGLGAAWVRERTGSSFNFVVAHAANSVTFLAAAYAMGA